MPPPSTPTCSTCWPCVRCSAVSSRRTKRGQERRRSSPSATRLWQRRFGSDPGLVGRTITLEGEPYTVVGVMPERFRFSRWDSALGAARARSGRSEQQSARRALHRCRRTVKAGVTPSRHKPISISIERRLAQQFPDKVGELFGPRRTDPRHVRRRRAAAAAGAPRRRAVRAADCMRQRLQSAPRTRDDPYGRNRHALRAWRGPAAHHRAAAGREPGTAAAGGVAGLVLTVWAVRARRSLRPRICRAAWGSRSTRRCSRSRSSSLC